MISMLLKNIYNNSNFLFESINEIKYNIDNIEINLDKNTKLIISNNAYSLIQLNILHEFLNQINQNISIYEYVDFRISNQIIVKEKKNSYFMTAHHTLMVTFIWVQHSIKF